MHKLLHTYYKTMVAVLLCITVLAGCKKHINTFISLDKNDKNPYGCYVLAQYLDNCFDNKMIVNSGIAAQSATSAAATKLHIIVTPQFVFNEHTAAKLDKILAAGDAVLISTFFASHVNYYLRDAVIENYNENGYPMPDDNMEGMAASVIDNNGGLMRYTYPGARVEAAFNDRDTARTRILGYSTDKRPNFIQMQTGKAALYLHLSPLAFSNYFLLSNNNEQYFQQIFSRFPKNTQVVWEDDFMASPFKPNKRRPNWLSMIMRYPALRAGILTILGFIILFILIEVKRRRKYIPVIEPAKNDSLDFVRTIGQLYFEKKDNLNLAQKISAYFMEHVRTRYKVTGNNKDFEKILSEKSGAPASLIAEIMAFIKITESGKALPDVDLIKFKQKIEAFYNL